VKTQRILVVGPSWIGDMVMAQSLFITLRRHDPQVRIDVVAPRWSRAILARMPEVGESIEVGVQHGELGLRKRYAVGKRLRGCGYDRAIVLPRSLKSALLPFFARIPSRTGYRGESRYGLINDMRRLDRSLCPQTVQRFVALGHPPEVPLPPPIPAPRLTLDEESRQRTVKRLGLSGDGPIIGLVPGAQYGSSRRWPAERFGELARRLADEGYRIWIFGSAADREAAQAILDCCSANVTDLTGRTELEEVVDLISLAQVVVTNDTGLMHVAGAVGTRVVVVYGATTPEHTPSLAAQNRMIYRDIECSPCSARICPLGHNRCLTEIEADQVFEATRTLAHEPHILE
jgi:heptosyltransferase-2